MAFDSIVRNATLPDGRKGQDVAIADGRIVAVEPRIEAEAAETIDARGYLLAPPFVDCHFHLDATLSLGLPRLNVSGTLLEGIALWSELKPLLTHEAVAERALRYCDLAVSQGLLAIRSHVDVCDPRLIAVEALQDRSIVRDIIILTRALMHRGDRIAWLENDAPSAATTGCWRSRRCSTSRKE